LIESVLIANRGEIAVRIARACRDAGVRSIAVYSDADADAEHVRVADSAVRLGAAEVTQSYLSIDRILEAAAQSAAVAIHPGYGLLAENSEFASRVAAAGLVFVGPGADVIALLGDKRSARGQAESVGLSVLPARLVDDDLDTDADIDALTALAAEVGYPLLVKAAFGGGGRGMRIVQRAAGLAEALVQARRENRSAFGRADVYLERFLPRARHIEVQVLRDAFGTVVHLGTRDCTTQRRNQKLIEEAPAFELADELIERAVVGSTRLAEQVGYRGAATMEFLVAAGTDELFFLEVNTRVQVEHTVTELISGIDIVAAQLTIASGEPLPFTQRDVVLHGVGMEARINAEDATAGFRPHTGTIDRLKLPAGPWVRVDAGVSTGTVVTQYYDSLLAKVAVWGPDRESARSRLLRALHETVVDGLPTTTGFVAGVLDGDQFRAGKHWTAMVDSGAVGAVRPEDQSRAGHTVEATGPLRRSVCIGTPNGDIDLEIPLHRRDLRTSPTPRTHPRRAGTAGGRAAPPGGVAPMDAVLIRHTVAVGDPVQPDTTVAVVESMKMEAHVPSGTAGVVTALHGSIGESLRRGQRLVSVEAGR
jgi:acetyl-CoA/propionyl-CoA carboxylase biotin carboxyl carrier protein